MEQGIVEYRRVLMALFGKKEKEKEKKQEKEVQEANITLYSCGNDPLKI